jgi:NAD(P)-dependent dehydrogenase (short-subunit alcohol dehydrogenase family)
MREQGSGRVINVSPVLGLVPAPFMALYAASKHAIEGYSESLDHELREYGVRVVLVEPAYTRTSFDANAVAVDKPLALHARRREAIDVLIADAVKAGDEPSVVGETIVAAATDTRPKLRYPAGTLARRACSSRHRAPGLHGEIASPSRSRVLRAFGRRSPSDDAAISQVDALLLGHRLAA